MNLRATRVWQALFWLALVFTLVMALLPKPPQVPGGPTDKVQHIAAFVVLTALMALAYRRSLVRNALVLIGFGALIEVLQAIEILHRSSDVADLAADAAAVVVVTVLAFGVRRLASPTRRPA